MGVEPDRQLPAAGKLGKATANGERVGDLAAEIIDQHGQRLVGERLVEHLGGADRGPGIADQRMRHGAAAARRRRTSARCASLALPMKPFAPSRFAASLPTEAA